MGLLGRKERAAQRGAHNRALPVERLAGLSAALLDAIAKARTHGGEYSVDAAFRKAVKHAREMHELLLAALIEHEPVVTGYLRGLAATTDNSIAELEAIARDDER